MACSISAQRALRAGLVFFGFQAAEHVLLYGHVGEQCVVLEQQAHAALLRRQIDVQGAVKQHPAVQYDAAASGFTIPAMQRRVMLLPQPDAPRMAVAVLRAAKLA